MTFNVLQWHRFCEAPYTRLSPIKLFAEQCQILSGEVPRPLSQPRRRTDLRKGKLTDEQCPDQSVSFKIRIKKNNNLNTDSSIRIDNKIVYMKYIPNLKSCSVWYGI